MAIKTGYRKRTQEEMDEQRSNFEYNRSSIVIGDDAVLITFLDQGIETTDPVTNVKTTIPMSVRVDKANLPTAPAMPRAGLKIGECMVMWNRKEQKVLAIGPYNGVFLAIGRELGPKGTDGQPVSSVKDAQGKNGPYKKVAFWCGYEITRDNDNGGLFIGAKPRYHLTNKFFDQDGFVGVMGKPESAIRTKQLFDWGQAHGIFAEDMPWPVSGNPLPAFQMRLQDNPKEVEIRMEKGYIASVRDVSSIKQSVLAEVAPEPEKVEEVAVGAENDDEFGDN